MTAARTIETTGVSQKTPIASAVKSYSAEFASYLCEHGAEGNYVIGTTISDLSATSIITLPSNASLGVTIGWNYLDGAYAIMLGLHQLADEENYRQAQNKAKGLLNIISGVQMFAFSYNPALTAALGLTGGAALAAPAFALSMLCELVTASIDFYNASREVEFTGWLEERAKESDYLQQRIRKLDKKIKKMQQQRDDDETMLLLNKKHHVSLQELINKKTQLENKEKQLIESMQSRSRVYCHDKKVNADERDTRSQFIEKTLIKLTTPIVCDYKTQPTTSDQFVDKKIQNTMKRQYNENLTNLIIKGISFVGMALLAVAPFVACPPLLIIGLVVTSLVAAYYLHKNRERISAKLCEIKDTLFGPSKKSSGFTVPYTPLFLP